MADEKKRIHPLLLEKNKRWIGAIAKGIAALDPQEQKLAMQDAGRYCSRDIWGLCEKALGSPVDSVDDLIRGRNLVRQSRNLHDDW
jgi:hypothetical protein